VLLVAHLGLELLAAPARQLTGLLAGLLGEPLALLLGLLGFWPLATAPANSWSAAGGALHGFLLLGSLWI